MTVKPWAGFIADFPDDQVEDGRSIEVFGGRNVAVAIGEILTGLGCEVSALESAEEKGWEFNFCDEERRRFWCQVTSFHPAFWPLFEDPAMTRGTRKKNAAAYAEMWRKLAAALDRDPRFHNIVWRSMDEGPPEPEEIGSSEAPEKSGNAVSDSLEEQFPPPVRPSGWGCLPILLAAFGLLLFAISLDGFLKDRGAHGFGDEVFSVLLGVTIMFAAAFWAHRRARNR